MAKLIAAIFLLAVVIVAEGIKVGDNCTTAALKGKCGTDVYGACEINQDCHCATTGTSKNADGSKCLGDAGSPCAGDSFCASDNCNMNTNKCNGAAAFFVAPVLLVVSIFATSRFV